MLDVSQNSCYLAVVRPAAKTVKHCATSECEIERVCNQNDYKSLQYSIKHSKMLENYKAKYPYTKPFQTNQASELMEVKSIGNQKSRFYVAKMLKQLHCYKYAVEYIASLKKQRYEKSNPDHEKLLIEIWKNLKPEEELESRISKQWITIGFQVEDPATDFRGAGYMGLFNLHRLSQNSRCASLFKVATDASTQYFFCSAGLFLTMMAFEMVDSRILGADFWTHDCHEEIMLKFQSIYQMLFVEFDRYWLVKCPNKTMMYFNQNLKNFQAYIRKLDSKTVKIRIALANE